MENDDGFTLLEALVALVILALVLAGAFERLDLGLRAASDTEEDHAVTEIAATFLAELGHTRPLAYGSTDGDLPQDRHWHLKIAPLRDPESQSPANRLQGHNISLAITWPRRGRKVTMAFETLELGIEP